MIYFTLLFAGATVRYIDAGKRNRGVRKILTQAENIVYAYKDDHNKILTCARTWVDG